MGGHMFRKSVGATCEQRGYILSALSPVQSMQKPAIGILITLVPRYGTSLTARNISSMSIILERARKLDEKVGKVALT
jgi:hypothetical protein